MLLIKFIILAHGLRATTYGWGGWNCGDIGNPQPCVYGAITASGEVFDPDIPSAAVAAPSNLHIEGVWVWLRVDGGPCVKIRVNDKSNPRWIGHRGFDLSPAAVKLLTGQATKYWSGKVYLCEV